ncbi:MAG: hypothetical protein NVS2B17_29760 [Candidatus Velthaea sp.]
MGTRTFAVALTIPDNEAFTARQTLQRIGIAVDDVRRADIWTFEVDDEQASALGPTVATIETIFNPNKHRLEERSGAGPDPGEVWIAPHQEAAVTAVGGRVIAGVRAIHRRTAWRLVDARGHDVEASELDRAVETFLCNPAFQKAIR